MPSENAIIEFLVAVRDAESWGELLNPLEFAKKWYGEPVKLSIQSVVNTCRDKGFLDIANVELTSAGISKRGREYLELKGK